MKHNSLAEDNDSNSDLIKKNDNINHTNYEGQTMTPQDQEKRKKIIKWAIIGAIITIIVVLAIVLPIVLTKNDNDNPNPPVPPEPFPHYNIYNADPKNFKTNAFGFSGFLVASQPYSAEAHQSALASLLKGSNNSTLKLGVKADSMKTGLNNEFKTNLTFNVGLRTWRVAHFTLTDSNNPNRYQIPSDYVPNYSDDQSMRLDMLGFSYKNDSFSFSFSDPITGNTYLSTKDSTLVFMDRYIQMDFNLPSQRVFGFGERVREFQLSEGTWTMWAIGQNSPYDDGQGRKNVYGVHPFIMVQGKSKDDFFGIYFRNSNFQSPVLRYNADGSSTLSYITTGGILDVYFFIHGSAKSIIQQYQTLFGTPYLPPYWSLGWQQASYKWTTQDMVQDVINNYTASGLPLDTIYLDIPYMKNYEDFTVDTDKFPDLTSLSESLHKNNQQIIVIIDAAVSADNTSSPYYQMGAQDGVFIKSSMFDNTTAYGGNLVSKVWPQKAVFVDWFNDKCRNLWHTGLNDLYKKVQYDGLWIDMNEPTTFVHGEINVTESKKEQPTEEHIVFEHKQERRFLLQDDSDVDYSWYYSFEQDKKSTYLLPFVPRFQTEGNFDNWTLSLNGTHSGLNGEQEYNVHSLYGHMMSYRTNEFLTQNDSYPNKAKRPFVLTRSTYTSTGKYASHWLGDNFRDWKYMKYSIAGIMNMNMFGIVQVGADVCGFFGTKRNDEMCARWAQLATFYPLARFHYVDNSDPNEPYLMTGKWFEIAKRTMHDRYQFLRHMYTCMFEAFKYGGTCIDPLFYYFPTDDKVYQDVESTFMVGGALKITPILRELNETETTMTAYFPNGTWVNIYNPTDIIQGPKTANLSTTGLRTHTHLKSGSLIAFQDNNDESVKTVSQLSKKGIQLLVNRDTNGYAYGSVFLGEGSLLSETDSNNPQYEYYQIHYQANSIQNMITEGTRGKSNYVLESIKIFNAADLEDVSTACYLNANNTIKGMQAQYDSENKTLLLRGDDSAALRFHDIHSIHFAKDGELSLCDQESFSYYISDGIIPELSGKTNQSLTLKHKAGTLPDIALSMRVLDGGIVNVKWTWANSTNGKRTVVDVPEDIVATKDLPQSTSETLAQYVKISDKPFKLNITNRDGATTVFSIDGMLYDEYFNWIKVKAYTESGNNFRGVFGLGERANNDFFFKDGVYGMHSRDQPTPDEHGTLPGANMYGVHPFFMYKYQSNAWVGVYYKLAQAQDWWIKNDQKAGSVSLTTISIGGSADIYIMIGTKPDAVIAKYFKIVGQPVLVPQWALGWNQCRWGYQNLSIVKEVVANYSANDLPLDVQWSDIDYMNQYRIFEYDTLNFAGLPDFIENTLHKNNMKWVPIIDAGLAYRPNQDYEALNEGQKKDLFMKINGEIFNGQVWPNDAVYPDFFHPDAASWWKSYLTKMHKTVSFDGLWEDMNEASNFCNGVCYQRQAPPSPVKQKLPYVPTGRDLETKSMALDTTHHNGYTQLDTHSMFGIQEIKVTDEWFNQQNMRTFIIERSSLAGMGKWASKWLGDNFSNEQQMSYSVSGVMLMNMFGFTLAGADICGFIFDTTPELCTKWHVVGSFYPFSRNHNNWGQIPQEPWVFKDDNFNGVNALNVMRDAIKRKYSLIRYYYSNLFEISTDKDNTGTFFKPLFFEFPDDINAYSDIVYNVMLGSALKLSINPESLTLEEKDYYFPSGLWCAVSGNLNVGDCFTSAGQNKTYPAGLADYQLHLRDGYIVPMQDTSSKAFKTSVDLQSWSVDFHVLGEKVDETSSTWNALGTYINDDGLTRNYTNVYNKYTLKASYVGSALSVTVSTDVAAQNQKYSQEAGCTAVNQNDFLSKIYFYNANDYKLTGTYTVNANFKNETSVAIGQQQTSVHS